MCGCTQSPCISELTQTSSTNTRSNTILHKFSKSFNLNRKYTYISKIGSGAFGKVFLYSDKTSKIQYAIKRISKYQLTPRTKEFIKNEVSILSSLDHPNIVKYFETFEDENYLQVVMEYIPGNNIFTELTKYSTHLHKPFLTESKICEIIYTLLKTLNFLHSHGIIHRDIKPENILWGDINDCSTLKIIDFGLSLNFNEDKGTQKAVGTPYYMSPEAINGKFYPESDVWSIGVIMFAMFTGKYPFQGKSRKDLFMQIMFALYDKELLYSQNISKHAKDLIERMFILDPKKRISVESALKHKCFEYILKHNTILVRNAISNEILDSIQRFQNMNLFQKEILYYFAKISKDKDIKDLKNAFILIDKDNSGEIEYEEIPKIFKEQNIKMEDKKLKEIFKSLDFHHDGKVNYCEFIAATLPSLDYFDEEKLMSAFKYFDINDNGYITVETFIEALKQHNVSINEKKIRKCFGKKKDGMKIYFEDFKKMIYSNEY